MTPALYAPSKKWTPTAWPMPEPPGEQLPAVEFNRDEPPVRQTADWTCSCASMAWVMNALGVPAPDGGKWDEWTSVSELRRLTYDGAVSPAYGLANGSGVDLETVYNAYGYTVTRELGCAWDTLMNLCAVTIGQMAGGRLYHWMGVRGYNGGGWFDLANPAPNWRGIQDDLDPDEWNTWGGWNAVMVTGRV